MKLPILPYLEHNYLAELHRVWSLLKPRLIIKMYNTEN